MSSKSKKRNKRKLNNSCSQNGIRTETGVEVEALCLKEVKIRISEDPELCELSDIISERFLLHFVRGRKYRPDDAFTTLRNYIKVRKEKYPDIFRDLRPSTGMRLIKHKNFIKVLKHRDELGRVVILSYVKEWDPKLVSADELIAEFTLYLDDLMLMDGVETLGVVVIIDLSDYGMRHVRTATPLQMWKIINIFHKAIPIRVKGSHFLNESYLFSLAKSLLKLFPHKMQERLHFHSNDMGSLHRHISPSILPKSLGGTLSNEEAFMDLSEMEERISNKENYYDELAKKLWNTAGENC